MENETVSTMTDNIIIIMNVGFSVSDNLNSLLTVDVNPLFLSGWWRDFV